MSGKFLGLLFLIAIAVPTHSITCKAEGRAPLEAASHSDAPPSQKASKTMPVQENHEVVVNWDPPTKRDLVEIALHAGMTDPAKIVKYAKKRRVTMTVEEVLRIEAELKKSSLGEKH